MSIREAANEVRDLVRESGWERDDAIAFVAGSQGVDEDRLDQLVAKVIRPRRVQAG